MAGRVEQFAGLVAQHPENGLFRFSLAQALIAAGRPADAVPHLEFCIHQKADWMLPRILLGKHLLATGQPAVAKPILEDALRLALTQDHQDPAEELQALLHAT